MISLFDNVISIFLGFRYLPCIIFLTLDNLALLRLHVWISRGKHDLPTITPSGRAQDWRMCASFNAGDAAFAVRYALRNATTSGGDNEDDDMSRVLSMANPCARVRDFISRSVCLCRELDIVSLARTVKIRKPIIPIGGVCIPIFACINACLRLLGDFAATKMHNCFKTTVSSHIFQKYDRSSI